MNISASCTVFEVAATRVSAAKRASARRWPAVRCPVPISPNAPSSRRRRRWCRGNGRLRGGTVAGPCRELPEPVEKRESHRQVDRQHFAEYHHVISDATGSYHLAHRESH